MLIQLVEIELFSTTILATQMEPETPAGLGTASSGITASKWPLKMFALTSDQMLHLSAKRVMWYFIDRRGIQRRTFSDRPERILRFETTSAYGAEQRSGISSWGVIVSAIPWASSLLSSLCCTRFSRGRGERPSHLARQNCGGKEFNFHKLDQHTKGESLISYIRRKNIEWFTETFEWTSLKHKP